jgi:phosphoglycerate dehydrogenase-like enzyme
MPRIELLVICQPRHRSLRALEALRDSAAISITDEPQEAARRARTAEVILYSGLAGASVALPAIWSDAKAVRWVHTLSAGVDRVLFPALITSPVPLTNARGVFKRSLAEFAVLGMLFHLKQVRRLVDNQRHRRWEDFHVQFATGRVMGVVGYGDIGRECALLARGLGLTIHALRRNPEKSTDDALPERLFGPERLHEFLAGVDVLVCAAPLTPATHHLLGDAEFRVMKPSAIVINVGRGPVIDEAALIRALRDGRIAAASLDVYDQEPLPADSPLWELENVLLSPHCADRTIEPDWLDLSMSFFIDNYHRYRNGQALLNVVDKQAGY